MSYEIIIREVSVLPNQCSSCRGSGKLEYRGAGFIECPACRGIGYIQSVRELDDPEMENHLLRCMHEHDMARRRASYLRLESYNVVTCEWEVYTDDVIKPMYEYSDQVVMELGQFMRDNPCPPSSWRVRFLTLAMYRVIMGDGT